MLLLSVAALLLVACSCALLDSVRRGGLAPADFRLALLLSLIGASVGWAMGLALDLPELVSVRLAGQPAPVFWSCVGAATFLLALDVVAARRRRQVAASGGSASRSGKLR